MKPSNRYVNFPPPIPTFGELIPSEESALFWLWAWPRLLGWPLSINWLCSPVVDSRRKSPGGLWGVDSTGSLIIVDTRTDLGTAPDPFESFVPQIKSALKSRDWTAEELRARWLKCVDRLAYGTSIAPLIRNGTYQRSIERSLGLRSAAGNPLPVFVGLVASTRSGFRLSHTGMKNLVLLQKHVGRERVLLRAISATLGSRGLSIHCWSPNSTRGNETGRAVSRTVH